MDRADERSAFAWIMSGTVGAVMVGSLGKVLLDRRRERALAEAQSAASPSASVATASVAPTGVGSNTGEADASAIDTVEAEGHPS